MNRTPSFSQRMHAGESKEQLMKYYVLTEAQYQKIVLCLDRIGQEAIEKRSNISSVSQIVVVDGKSVNNFNHL